MAEAKYKIGDKLRCKLDFSKNNDSGSSGGGAGYIAGKEFQVRRLTIFSIPDLKGPIYWPGDGGNGVYEVALEKVDSVVNTYLIY